MSIINEINLILSTRERGGTQQPCIAACVNVFWWPLWSTCANCHTFANRACRALSTDAWQLAWVGQKCHQNRLIMVRLLCHRGSSSSMFCGCGVAIVRYTSCKVQRPQPCETFPLFILIIKWYPVLGEHRRIISSLRRLFCRGEQLARDEDRDSILGGNIWGFGDTSAQYSAK
jgi:hypothetical protein